MQRQLNYITQEKTKSEILAVQTVALIKKNNEDYNQLLKYAADIREAMIKAYDSIRSAKLEGEK